AGKKTGRRASQNAFALLGVPDEGDIGASERKIAFANLPLEARSQKFRHELVGGADAPDQAIDIDGKLRDVALLLGCLQNQQDFLSCSQSKTGNEDMSAIGQAFGEGLRQ